MTVAFSIAIVVTAKHDVVLYVPHVSMLSLIRELTDLYDGLN